MKKARKKLFLELSVSVMNTLTPWDKVNQNTPVNLPTHPHTNTHTHTPNRGIKGYCTINVIPFQNGIERGKEDSCEEAFHQSGAEINRKQENAKQKGSDTGELTTKDTLSTRSESNDCNQALTSSKTNALAFHIPVEQTVCKPPPKRFCNQTKKGRENISIERIAEKQEMAERRKNVRTLYFNNVIHHSVLNWLVYLQLIV